ncbi:MAG: glycosyltransferase family 39 protein [Bryobacterales bacterium]|nr:glycosyltransferase family 39 protein [Bryobacterales bacterium]
MVRRWRSWGGRALELALYIAVALTLQWARGDWSGGWSGWQDESGHFMTGLMLHDYVRGHLFEHPLRFAEAYYDHYQKVMMGHWPPMFYVLHGVWYFLFEPKLLTALWMMAIAAALVSLLISLEIRRFAPRPAIPMGLLWLLLPPVRTAGEKVYSELVVVLFSFLAVRAYARYLEKEQWWQSALFGVFTTAAIMTKGTGLALAAVPVAGVLLTRKLDLMRRAAFWIPAAMVVAICLPWYLFVPGAKHEKVLMYGGPGVRPYRAKAFFRYFRQLFPLPLWPVAGAAYLATIRMVREWPFAAASLGLTIGTFAGTISIGVWEPRHLVTLGPLFLVTLAYAVHWCAPRFPRNVWQAGIAAMALAVFAWYCLGLDQPIPRKLNDYREAARLAHQYPVVFVTGYGDMEGDFTSEFAILETRRPQGTVIRAGKVMSESDMVGSFFKMKFSTPEELRKYMKERAVGMIVMDEVRGQDQPDLKAVRAFLEKYGSEWEKVRVANPRVTLYRALGAAN